MEDTKVIEIWTIQISKWRAAKKAKVHLLDITAKSGFPQFAPDFRRVMEYKNGQLDEETYTELYLDKILYIKEKKPDSWEVLKTHPRVALGCYCRKDAFCHRHIFLPKMEEYLIENGIAPRYMGELE